MPLAENSRHSAELAREELTRYRSELTLVLGPGFDGPARAAYAALRIAEALDFIRAYGGILDEDEDDTASNASAWAAVFVGLLMNGPEK